MQKLWSALSSITVIVAAFATLSCGTNSSSIMGPADPAGLQSVALAPATANAQMYPNGQVPFVATGYYIDPVRTVTPLSARWGVCQANTPTTEVTVSQTGVATCAMGATGTFTVFAFVGTQCNAITTCGGGCTVRGAAQLTCP